MEVILDILQDGEVTPWSMIQQGKVLRLLDRFDEAVVKLRAVPANGHSEVSAVKIETLARNGDMKVRMLSSPTW